MTHPGYSLSRRRPRAERYPVEMAAQASAKLPDLPRFKVLRVLGEGGFGTVYEAEDTVRGGRVALKRLSQLGAEALYRFKREFRSLADVVHPNLVHLHELLTHEGEWYLTMEVVAGEGFLAHVRAGLG